MSGWQIVEWSRERGRGTIASSAGRLEFDGHVALVDDFRIGEEVEIRLANGVVARIAPVLARSVVEDIPDRAPQFAKALARFTKQLGMGTDLVIVQLTGGRLDMELWNHDWPPPSVPPLAKASFREVAYLQIEMRTERFVRVRARSWRDVNRAKLPWLRELSVESDEVDPDAIIFIFEDDTFGARPGFVIASAVTVQ